MSLPDTTRTRIVWLPDEDKRLIKLAKAYDMDWKIVNEHFEDKSIVSCCKRYRFLSSHYSKDSEYTEVNRASARQQQAAAPKKRQIKPTPAKILPEVDRKVYKPRAGVTSSADATIVRPAGRKAFKRSKLARTRIFYPHGTDGPAEYEEIEEPDFIVAQYRVQLVPATAELVRETSAVGADGDEDYTPPEKLHVRVPQFEAVAPELVSLLVQVGNIENGSLIPLL